MFGYTFETTNKKTGEKYIGKKYAVTFDKNYLGEDEKLAVAIEKYGRPSFEVKMIMPYESPEAVDAAFEELQKSRKPAKKQAEPKEKEPEVVAEPVKKPAKRKTKKTEEE